MSLQLFGSDSDIMAEAARMIADRDFDVLDVNMGCPVAQFSSEEMCFCSYK